MNEFAQKFLRLQIQEAESWTEASDIAFEAKASSDDVFSLLTPAEQRWVFAYYSPSTPQEAWNKLQEQKDSGELYLADRIWMVVSRLRGEEDQVRVTRGEGAKFARLYDYEED